MHKLRPQIFIYSVLFFSFALTACAGVKVWPEKAGQVLDDTTNQPIAGAIVVALWEGHRSHAFIKSRRVCYHVETTTTDQQGRYSFASRFDGLMRGQIYDKFSYHTIYKAGYVTSDKTYEKAAYRKNLKYLKPFKGTHEERLRYLKKLAIHGCGSDDESKKIVPFNRAILNEAKKTAKTKADMKIVNSLRAVLDLVELGGEETQRRIGEGRYR